MVTFRTLLLQVVFIVQFICFTTSNCGEVFQPSEIKSRADLHTQYEISSNINESTNQTDSLRIVETRYINNPLFRKETPVKCLVQPSIITKEKLPVKAKTNDIKRPHQNMSFSNFIRVIGAGEAQLF